MCCSIHDPKGIVRSIARIGLGLALVFVGFTHYQDPQFAVQTGMGLGVLTPLGAVWGYVFPGLMIFGGVLLAFGIYLHIAASAAGIALASIPAGLALKSAIGGIPLEDMLPSMTYAFVWIIVLLMCLKNCCCCVPEAKAVALKPAAKPAPVPAARPPVSAPKTVVAKKSAPNVPAATVKAGKKKS